MLKFATAQIIAASLGDQQRVTKSAHRAVFQYDARPGYLYVRSRAISSRCNDNWDEFPADEIAKSYGTFIGKPVFVNHKNDNHRRARGVVIDAALHEDKNPDGTLDTWAEVLMEIDAKQFPKLAKAILAGHVDRTSMGCDVEYSVCSACNNRATTPAEYCAHIPGLKGKRIFRHTASGQRVGELVRETCYGLSFFENSVLVEPPADPTAHFLGVDASGLGKAASIDTATKEATSLPAGQPFCSTCNQDLEMNWSPKGNSWSHSGGTVTGHPAVPHDGRTYNAEAHRQDEAAIWATDAADQRRTATALVSADSLLPDGTVRPAREAKLAYGEVKAPQDVDTLREENCPVCGDKDTYDGQACQICGFISPPTQFRDPDLDMAKRLDLRKQIVDPSLVDDNGELERVDQGGDAMPQDEQDAQDPNAPVDPNDPASQMIDPDQVDENGLPPSPYGDQALDGTQQGPGMSDRNGDGMVQPSEIDMDGNVNVQQDSADPGEGGQTGPRELPYRAQDHAGDSFTPGPDMPYRPDDPANPNDVLGQDDDDHNAMGMPTPEPMMGRPGDGVPDLLCGSCGFQADATPPQTQNMGNPMAATDGVVDGDVCPNCQRGQLLTPGEVNSTYSKTPAVERPAYS
ncbi:hypothetical protein [Streptomyces sp. NPDC088727]|uniref:hypothetical protein n=1 Tax=Streptomyces sp. NPDC088727 TaxID=3365875 RepID=UPI00382E7A72